MDRRTDDDELVGQAVLADGFSFSASFFLIFLGVASGNSVRIISAIESNKSYVR